MFYGEIKGLSSSILRVKTPNSEDDFQIKFSRVTELQVQRPCNVVLTGGRRRTGYISSKNPNEFTMTYASGLTEVFPIRDLVELNAFKKNFWQRFRGNIDVSYNLTKANNASQLNIGGGLGYRGSTWNSSFDISSLQSQQKNTADIQRTDIKGEVQRVLTSKYYLLSTIGFLSNTEQALKGRYSIRVGVGRFLALSNRLAWGLSTGINYNIENFSNATPSRTSTEFVLGTELDMFDFKDWHLKTNLNVFPSLTESSRWRIDYNLDIKWEIISDFYVKSALQFNYDNQVAAEGSQFDYILTTGIG